MRLRQSVLGRRALYPRGSPQAVRRRAFRRHPVLRMADKTKDGRPFFTEMTLHKVDFGDREYILSNVHDISQRKATVHKILQMARFDSLTGPRQPRPSSPRPCDQAIAARRGSDFKGFALLYLDVDHFKDVNDTLGHPIGDALLKARGRAAARAPSRAATSCLFVGDEATCWRKTSVFPSSHVGVVIKAGLERALLAGGRSPQRRQRRYRHLFGPCDDAGAGSRRFALYRAKVRRAGHLSLLHRRHGHRSRRRRRSATIFATAVAAERAFPRYQPQVESRPDAFGVGPDRWRPPAARCARAWRFMPYAEFIELIVAFGHFGGARGLSPGASREIAQHQPFEHGLVNDSALQFKTPLALENDIPGSADFLPPAISLDHWRG